MELRHLHAFAAVAELRSFGRAAERLHLSQSPLTRQIQALETELGVRLLERGSRREVTLTEAGRLLLVEAKEILDRVEAMRRHSRRARNRLAIANHSELSARVLPAWLRAFQSGFPQVEVSILEMNGAEKFAALRTGRAQLALAADHILAVDPRFRAEALFSVPLLAVLPAGHALAKRKTAEIKPAALAQETILYKSPEHAPCYSQRLPELFRRAEVTPRALRAVDGMGNVLAMVAAGYGVAVLPDIFRDNTLPPTLRTKRLRLPAAMPPLQLFMVWRPDDVSPALRGFIEVARRFVTTTTAEGGAQSGRMVKEAVVRFA